MTHDLSLFLLLFCYYTLSALQYKNLCCLFLMYLLSNWNMSNGGWGGWGAKQERETKMIIRVSKNLNLLMRLYIRYIILVLFIDSQRYNLLLGCIFFFIIGVKCIRMLLCVGYACIIYGGYWVYVLVCCLFFFDWLNFVCYS